MPPARAVLVIAVVCASLWVFGREARPGQPARVALQVAPATVGKYEKVEFRIGLATVYQNPFDPREVEVTILLTAPSGQRIAVPAFFCQTYERQKLSRGDRTVDWLYPTGQPGWHARFAPSETGTYRAVAQCRDGHDTQISDAVRFKSVPSKRKGFVRVSPKDPRFLEFSEGEAFFPVGQNLAFIGETQYANLDRSEEIFGKLAACGANFLRIWTCCEDWAMALEARKSAWGRSWDWKPPIVPTPDNPPGKPERKCIKLTSPQGLPVSPSHPVALRPGTPYVFSAYLRSDGQPTLRIELNGRTWAEPIPPEARGAWTPIRYTLTTGPQERWLDRLNLRLDGAGTVWLDRLSLRESGQGPELLWEADVNRPIRGFYNPVDAFMLDEIVRAAEEHALYLQLCVITRDLYMASLKQEKSPEYQQAIEDAKRLMRYAVARWGYSTHVAAWEYFNEIDPNLPTDRFYRELGAYLEEVDVYRHLRTTSAWGPSPKDCRHEKLDIAQVHYYLRPADRQRIPNEVEAAVDRTAFLRQHAPAKPALIGEFGLANDQWREDDLMRQDREFVHFHNALWASALAGSSGTALLWWWDELDRKDAYHHYRPLAAFLAGIPWTTARLQPTGAELSRRDVRLIGLQGPRCAYLWMLHPKGSWLARSAQSASPSEIKGLTLRIAGLEPGAYQVEWWDTADVRPQSVQQASASGDLRLDVPPLSADLACKVLRLGQ